MVFESFGSFLAVGGSLYFMLVLWRLLVLQQGMGSHGQSHSEPLSIMIPVYGKRTGLYRCLRACCLQATPNDQVIFGLHTGDDSARGLIENLLEEFPLLDMVLIINDRRIGSNPKICNLANMYPAVKHERFVMLDSDVLVPEDFLQRVGEAMQGARVGAVTCLYQSAPASNLASSLGALFIDEWLLPSMLVDLAWGDMDICYGAAIAVQRTAFEDIGGFPVLANSPAEDDLLGELMSRHGYQVKLAQCVVSTVVSETSIRALFRHELRWMRSVRYDRPVAHFFSLFTHALLPASGLMWLAGGGAVASGLICLIYFLRVSTHFLVRRRLNSRYPAALWMLMLREMMSCMVWLASFASEEMDWSGQRLLATAGRDMRLVPERKD